MECCSEGWELPWSSGKALDSPCRPWVSEISVAVLVVNGRGQQLGDFNSALPERIKTIPMRDQACQVVRWCPVQSVNLCQIAGPWLNIKMSSYQYRKSHCGDKTVIWSSYLHNGISYTGKTTSLYWFSPLQSSIHCLRESLYKRGLKPIQDSHERKNLCFYTNLIGWDAKKNVRKSSISMFQCISHGSRTSFWKCPV